MIFKGIKSLYEYPKHVISYSNGAVTAAKHNPELWFHLYKNVIDMGYYEN